MKDFSPLSKVWVYQADRTLTEIERNFVTAEAQAFIADWTAHGKLLKAKLEVYYNQFLVLLVDETQADASGCGIDKSVHFIQRMEQHLKINLMNRLLVAYKENDQIKTCSLVDFEKKFENKEVNSETIVFNNLVGNKLEFESNWEIPLSKSWHSKRVS